MLHTDPKFHPYKIMAVHELQERDWENTCYAVMVSFKIFLQIPFSSRVMKLTFIPLAASISRIFATGRKIILHSFMRVTLWCVFVKFGVWGSLLFWGGRILVYNNRNDRYVEMMRTILLRFRGSGSVVSTGWNHRTYSEKINGSFGKDVSRVFHFLRGVIEKPARSPNVATCDYFHLV